MKNPIPWRLKLRAFGAHVAISVAVFAAIIGLTVELWYPQPFFWIDGGVQITLLAAFVDIVLGPSLTFVVYRPRKAGLAMNLAVIGAFQIAALAWGVQTLYTQRPLLAAFIGHNQNRFFPITAEQIATGPRPLAELLALSPSRPAMVYVELPTEQAEANRLLTAFLSGGTSVLRQTERFRRIEGEALARIAAGTRTRATYEKTEPPFAEAIDRFVAAHGGDAGALAFIPLYGRFGRGLLAFSKTDGSLIGVVAKEFRWR